MKILNIRTSLPRSSNFERNTCTIFIINIYQTFFVLCVPRETALQTAGITAGGLQTAGTTAGALQTAGTDRPVVVENLKLLLIGRILLVNRKSHIHIHRTPELLYVVYTK